MAAAKTTAKTKAARIERALKTAFDAAGTTGGEDTVKIRVCAGTTCNASGGRR